MVASCRANHSTMFFRSKPVGSYRYLQIVHSVREGKKVRQQVIATLGRLDLLEASGQLERLMRSGLRHCESFAVLDAHAAGEIQPVAIRRIGPDLVFARLWKESGIQEVLRSVLKARQYEFDLERAIYLIVLHRLFASGSDRAAERWREDYLIAGTEGLELHHLYRAMAFLGDAIEQLEKPTGAVRCNKTSSRRRSLSADGIYLPKSNWSFSIPLRSTLKAAAESRSANAVTLRITDLI